jgi:hypothetical protein
MKINKKNGFAAVFLFAMTISPLVMGTMLPSVQARTVSADKNAETVSPESRRPRPKLKDYILVGADGKSNAYTGDTNIKEAHGLLCIKKLNISQPFGLSPAPSTTPGGALRDSWSGGYLFVIPNVTGTTLTSKAVADNLCNKYGQSNYGVTDYRMAEFHDGDQKGLAGWSFWGDAAYSATRDFEGFNDRLWVAINDQNANPWGAYNQTADGQSRKALTFSKLAQVQLPGETGVGNIINPSVVNGAAQ